MNTATGIGPARWTPFGAGTRIAWLFALLALGTSSANAQVLEQGEVQLSEGQQVILITGSTDGLGREVARRLAEGGAHVIVHGRNRERGEALVREIEDAGKGSARFYAADFGSLAEVRSFAETILRDYPRLDVLVNNAGIWLVRPPERRVSADGHEMHFAVNYLAGYALTHLLLPRLIESSPARIVNVASAAQAPLDFEDVNLERDYSPSRAYAVSKLAQVTFTIDLAEQLEGTGVTVTALHPATMMNTSMVIETGMPPRSTVEEGVEAVLQLVTGPDVVSGQYYNGLVKGRVHPQAEDREARARVRSLSEALTAITPAGR